MEILLPRDCKATQTWRTNKNNNDRRTLFFKPLTFTNLSRAPSTFIIPSSSVNPSASLHFSNSKFQHRSSSRAHSQAKPNKNSCKGTTPHFEFETVHQIQSTNRTLTLKLKERDLDSLQVLRDDRDWSKEHFWAVIRSLKQNSRSEEVLQVLDLWKNNENSRINEFNYEKIIGLLVEDGLIEEAVSALGEMKSHGLRPSLEIYNSMIHGFSRNGRFEDALFCLKEMEEIDLKPDTQTHDGLIQAYGNYRMYDEMGRCVKKMESNGCLPDHITYNLLIREFS